MLSSKRPSDTMSPVPDPILSKTDDSADFHIELVRLRYASDSDVNLRATFCDRFNIQLQSLAAHSAHLTRTLRNIGEQLDCDLRQVEAIVKGLIEGTQNSLLAEEVGVAEATLERVKTLLAENGLFREEEPESPELNVSVSSDLGGALADYDNEMKILWRERISEFIATHTTLAEREQMVVVCLPSRYPRREVEMYLKLGFRPQNIIAVEGDPTVRAEFEQRCGELGIEARFGRLAQVLASLKNRPVDLLSYDSTGPISLEALSTLSQVWLSKKALVITNFMAARESPFAKEILERLTPEYKNREDVSAENAWEEFRELFGDIPPVGESNAWFDLLRNRVVETRPSLGESPISLARDESLDIFIASVLSSARLEHLGTSKSFVSSPALQDAAKVLERSEPIVQRALYLNGVAKDADASAFRCVGKLLSNGYNVTEEEAAELLHSLTHDWIKARPNILAFDRLQYRSPIRGRNTPFRTSMLVLERPEALYRTIQGTASFLANIQFAIGADFMEAIRMQRPFSNVRFEIAEKTRKGAPSKYYVICQLAGKELGRINVKSVRRDIAAYIQLANQRMNERPQIEELKLK